MATVTLNDLFPLSHDGKMIHAENSSGELVHVDEVPNGLKCKCTCSGCGGKLIAKNKGKLQDHHFAHIAETVDYICKSAGETALHKEAKKYLAESLELTLPELKVTDGKFVEIIPEGIHRFQKAELEKPDGQITPDVVVWRNRNKKLFVEFKVTHPCDEYKIAKIKALNVGAIEIDLNEYRELPISELSSIILHEAKRKWLHSPKTAEMHEEIGKKKIAEHGRNLIQSDKLAVSQNKKLHPSQEGENKHEVIWRGRKLGANFIGFEIGLEGCFLVRTAEWQSALVEYAIKHPNKFFDSQDLFEFLLDMNYVSTEFENVSDDVIKLVKEKNSEFQRPTEIIQKFLNRSNAFEKSNNHLKDKWRLRPEINSFFTKLAKQKKNEADRLLYLREIVKAILDAIPAEEKASFNFEIWLNQIISGHDYSMRLALGKSTDEWSNLAYELSELTSPEWPSRFGHINDFGLPVKMEIDRRLEVRRIKSEQKAIDEKERLRIEGVNRVKVLRRASEQKLGAESNLFLTTAIKSLDGLAPIVAAENSELLYQKAFTALQWKVHELDSLRAKLADHESQKVKLFNQVLSYCNDHDTAFNWCKCTNALTGSMRPNEYCTSETRRIEAYDVFVKAHKKKIKRLT